MTINWIRIDTAFCKSCCVMFLMVLRKAIRAKMSSCTIARKTIAFSEVKTRCQGPRSIGFRSGMCLVDDDSRDDGVNKELRCIGGHGGHDARHHGGGEQSRGDSRA